MGARRYLLRGTGVLLVAVMLLAAALAWEVHALLGGIPVSRALGSEAPRSSHGAMNVLLIGLDSRKDQDGNDLPPEILEALHAGDSSVGGYNTNTLILVHIAADGRAVAFSIPRDDYVPATGISGPAYIKIKEAYGRTMAQARADLQAEGVPDGRELHRRSRDAGRSATVAAVRDLTGQPVDYFAEVNLAGFYDLTESLGGVEVCLNDPVRDEYSGAAFPAGRQWLDAAQALAFVRQRHGLPNGDLDRTHRQQAYLASIMQRLRRSGVLNNLSNLRSVLNVARKDLVLSAGWGEAQVRRMASVAGGDVEFRTLPVVRYQVIDGSDVNIVNPADIRREIAAAIAGDRTPAATTVSVSPESDSWGGTPIPGRPDAGPPLDGGDGVPCVD